MSDTEFWCKHADASIALWNQIETHAPEQLARVMQGAARVELEPDYMGFVLHYAHLADLIPKHWWVVDLGCSYAAQAWYFRDHAGYTGVDFPEQDTDFGRTERFVFSNTHHVGMAIADYLDTKPVFEAPVFALCNYVPINDALRERVRRYFPNLFMFYPQSTRHSSG